jgi:proteasome alpha subunit
VGVMGGQSDKVEEYLTSRYSEGLDLDTAIKLAVEALGQDTTPPRTIPASDLEVGVLDRTRTLARKFKRLSTEAVEQALGG